MNSGRWVEVRYRPDSGCASLKTRSELATADAQLGIWEAVAVREATDLYVHRRVDRFLFFPTVSSICKKRLRIVSAAAFLLFCQEDLCSSSSSSSSLFYAPILLEWTQTLKAKEEKRNRRREQQLDYQTFFFFFWLLHLLPDSSPIPNTRTQGVQHHRLIRRFGNEYSSTLRLSSRLYIHSWFIGGHLMNTWRANQIIYRIRNHQEKVYVRTIHIFPRRSSFPL